MLDGLLLATIVAGLVIGAASGNLALGLITGTGIGLVLRGVTRWVARRRIHCWVGLICLGMLLALAAPLYQAGSSAGERDREQATHASR